MVKEILLIYQDCALCGARKSWGEDQTKIANSHGFEIKKVPFYSENASGLIMKALEKGIGKMPFFTDGVKFSYSLEDFVEAGDAATKAKKKAKGGKNGDTLED